MDPRERALAECLDALSRGADEAAILAAHPDLAGELRPLVALAAAMARLPALPGPEPAFRARLAAALASAPEPGSLSTPPLPTTLVVQALDEALARLEGGEKVADVVAGLPPGAGELRSLVPLAAALEDLPQAAGPTATFRRALAAQLASAPHPTSVAALRPVRGAVGAWLGRFWASTAASAAVAATVVLFAGAGLGVAARDALPGAGLYPVKLGMERLQVWLAGDVRATAVHLEHARRRLDEAIQVPEMAVASLGRFNRDVTDALGGADAALAAGAPREHVADPMVAWLGTARHDLIAAQARMPVAAWRAARAIVDEGILAFQGQRGLAERPVPRLAPGDEVLAARATMTHPWSGRVVLAPVRSPLQAVPPAAAALPAPGPQTPPVVQVAVAGPAVDALVPAAPPEAPAPTMAAAPEPTRAPERERPSEPRTPEPPAVPTEPPPDPTSPAPDPTETPAPTPTPGAPQPTVLELHCTPDPVKSAGTAECQVTNLDGEAVDIAWTVSMGRMEPTDGDPRSARFVDVGGISGVSRLFVTVTAALVPGPEWGGGEPPIGQVVIIVEPEHGVAP